MSDNERRVIEEHVIGKELRLLLMPGLLTYYDNLYFDEESRAILRDVGVFPDEYRIKVRLTEVEVRSGAETKGVLKLYPYRDIEAPEA
ncbi:hypothetical protein [Vulcanisaeta thermophila]|uniref:hypothetical protein n=1 Tax=Vulcanisaeta thermophila TaxID=867917 RepID=UPI0008537BDC|nr:hypothetical protein [Vulcanisaeta thermophila]